MDRFYFMRHGQTDANLQHLMCGAKWNIELNAVGLEQAARAADLMHDEARDLAAICASPLVRALKTAELTAGKFSLPITTIDELQEWDIGSWDRVPFEQVKDAFLGTGEPVGGESRAVFRERVGLALEKARLSAAPVLLVSHGAVWLAVQEILGIPSTRVENAIPHEIRKTPTGWIARKL